MSGIAGIYYLDGCPVQKTDVEGMANSITHRGPDGFGIWTDGPVGLGHRMLWTTPESLHEKLPLTSKTEDLTITADARIDNRDELISVLHFNGRPQETIADSELILAAYEKWGKECPKKLLGDFSFAIWDKRKKILFCARDPMGIKPFYYYINGKKFRWASEPKAIFEDSTIPKEPNLALICLYLMNRFDEREETLYKDIYRLPPSHFMVVENGRIHKGQYWDINPNWTIHYKTDEEYAEHFLSLFKDAVRATLRSHGPVGTLLSGGLDSSSIVCIAQKLYQENSIPSKGFETFSILFDTFPCDERSYIDKVVNQWNIHANCFTYEEHLSEVDFEQTKKFLDMGYAPTLFFFSPALRVAQQKGIRTMLNGIGGDELLAAGFDHLTDLLLQRKMVKLMAQIRQDSVSYARSPYSLFLTYCIKPLIPRPMKVALRYFLNPFRRNGVPSYINLEHLRKKEVEEPLGVLGRYAKFPTRAQQRINVGLKYGWNATVASDLADRFVSYFGIENRYPFFDRRLVEFCFALPEEQRWCTEWPKAVLRRATRGILPETVKNRKDKADFSMIIHHELNQRQVHKLDDLLQSPNLANLGVVDRGKLHQFLGDFRNGSSSKGADNALETMVWLELWYRSQWET